ncbi:hypothetical protein H0H93_016608 [Arthromyces matolae]|nr:hypothetical protein H0H93_016608 [Arthromyces matolae]
MVFAPGPSDPFYELMRPPPDETPAQATARQQRELDAKAHSDAIDETIKRDQEMAKKDKNVVKVLLLGQSESDFRMRFAREVWDKERNGWRAVVQLNVVRSILLILGIVETELNGEPSANVDDGDTLSIIDGDDGTETPEFNETHRLLSIRLAPLRGIEADLKRRLGAGSEPLEIGPMVSTPFEGSSDAVNSRRVSPEFTVRSWRDVVEPTGGLPVSAATSIGLDTATEVITGCKDDMVALWNDKSVRIALKRKKLRLPDSAGFFLNDLERIARRDYVVSDDDIVRARLRTVGIQEHQLKFQYGPFDNPKSLIYFDIYSRISSHISPPGNNPSGWEWRIFDVGGCRTSRAAWLPFFDNVNVIIFLSPVSVFDQRLEEDPRVNRLEDSIILWTSICQSKLLAKTQLILFLNKCDLLRRKLKRGIQVKDYLPSYGDRPNEVIPVVKYLREKFKDIQKHSSPEPRSNYIYPTTVTVRFICLIEGNDPDTEATAVTLESVRDGVLRENLATSQLI